MSASIRSSQLAGKTTLQPTSDSSHITCSSSDPRGAEWMTRARAKFAASRVLHLEFSLPSNAINSSRSCSTDADISWVYDGTNACKPQGVLLLLPVGVWVGMVAGMLLLLLLLAGGWVIGVPP